MQKEARFLNLVKKGVDPTTVGDLDRDVAAVKDALRNHYNWLMYVFLVHASSDVAATSGACMGWLTDSALMDLAGVADEAQRGCKQVQHAPPIWLANTQRSWTRAALLCVH